MEWLLCNCGLPAGLEGSATDSSAPEELDDTLEAVSYTHLRAHET